MRLIWFLSLILVLPLLTSTLNKLEREKICSKERDSCIWINSFFNKSRGFPIHNTVDFGHYLDVYCWDGPHPLSMSGLANVWHSLRIAVRCKEDADYITVHFSNTSHEIDESIDKLSYSDATNGTLFLHYAKPYGVFCVGVLYNGRDLVNYKFYADLVFMWRFPILLAIGAFLLFNARTMSRSILFHYGTGVTLGVVASMLVLLYIFSKFVPKKNVIGLGVLAGGFTLVGSFIYWLYKHSLELIVSMWQYFLAYVLIAGAITFAVIYRFGPVENPRTFNLIQWSIQLVGLLLIGLSSQIPEVGLVFIVVALLFYLVPSRYNPIVIIFLPVYYLLSCVLSPLNKCFQFLFGKRYKFKFLTSEEYDDQGRVETAMALNELRKFCKQNESTWEIIGKLKDANRFTRFLSGKGHVTEQEQVDHEWSFVMSSTDVDEDSDEEGERSGDYSRNSSLFYPSPSSQNSSAHSSSLFHTSDDSPGDHKPRLQPHLSPSRAPLHGRRYNTDSSPSHYRKH